MLNRLLLAISVHIAVIASSVTTPNYSSYHNFLKSFLDDDDCINLLQATHYHNAAKEKIIRSIFA